MSPGGGEGRRQGEDSRRYWDERHRSSGVDEPSPFLTELGDLLPASGLALDVAGGNGRRALWLAERGLDVTLVDISPVAVIKAQEEARRRRLRLHTELRDLEREGLGPGSHDVIACFHFLHRPLFPQMAAALNPDGLLVCEIATVRNLERHERPPRPFLLEEGEILHLTQDLESLIHTEGWSESGRHYARYVGRAR